MSKIIDQATFKEAHHQALEIRSKYGATMDSIFQSHEALRERAYQLQCCVENFLTSTPTDKEGNYDPVNQTQHCLAKRVMTAIKEGRL